MFFWSTDNEVFYMDCTSVPLEHLELTIREVFLPLLGTNSPSVTGAGINGDKLMDILHRLMAAVEVSQGHVEVSWGWVLIITGTCGDHWGWLSVMIRTCGCPVSWLSVITGSCGNQSAVLRLGCRIAEITLNVFIGCINGRLACPYICRKWEKPTFFNDWCGPFYFLHCNQALSVWLFMISQLLIARPIVAIVLGSAAIFRLISTSVRKKKFKQKRTKKRWCQWRMMVGRPRMFRWALKCWFCQFEKVPNFMVSQVLSHSSGDQLVYLEVQYMFMLDLICMQYLCASMIHQTMTWTTESLTCLHDLTCLPLFTL